MFYVHIFERTSNYFIFNLFQMPYVQSVMIFLIVVFELTGYLEIGDLNPKKPYLYLMSAILISFFVGLWALFVFLDVTKKYQLLHHFKYGQKAGLLKAIVILVNVQVCTIILQFWMCLTNIFHIFRDLFWTLQENTTQWIVFLHISVQQPWFRLSKAFFVCLNLSFQDLGRSDCTLLMIPIYDVINFLLLTYNTISCKIIGICQTINGSAKYGQGLV